MNIVKYFEDLSNWSKNDNNLFLSDIIKKMIENGIEFKPCEVEDYIDWGTKEDWFEYVRKYKTLFIDLDGTLVKSSGKHTPPYWGETEAIKENVDFVNKLYNTGKVYIIITTARDKEAKEVTLKQLKREGIKYHDIILGLYHSNRTIINDYGTSSPYPTCDAVNIVRNSNELERFLKDLGEWFLISHRGNIDGKTNQENKPEYIKKALFHGFNVEIDVWYIDNKYYLGHDLPQYEIEEDFLQNASLWCHAKNIEALYRMKLNPLILLFLIMKRIKSH